MDAFQFDRLAVQRYPDRAAMGKAAGEYAAAVVKKLLETRERVNILFPAAPSQNEVLKTFMQSDVDFSRIVALHMDEYIGLDPKAPQTFGHYLREHVFDVRSFAEVHFIADGGSAGEMVRRYRELIARYPLDMAFIGLGENGHIAFNDPAVADFNDPVTVKVVDLDDICRMQQVHDGCFPAFDDVPKQAVTVTIPAIMAAPVLVCTVPTANKAWAVENTAYAPVSTACPGTILRTHPNCTLFCDADSGRGLNEGKREN